MARSAQAAEIDLSPWRGRVPVEMLGRTRFPRIGELPYLLTLPPYGYFWFHLQEDVEGTQEITTALPEFVTLVLGATPATLLDPWSERAFERDVLPAFLATRRWFADKDVALRRARLHAAIPIQSGIPAYYLSLVDTETDRGASRYVLPLTIDWHRIDKTSRPSTSVVAAVRRGPREGTLVDAAADTDFIRLLLGKLHAGDSIEAGARRLVFRPTAVFQSMAPPTIEAARPVNREQSNTTIIVDATCVVKLFRRIQPGVHPEEEMGRFLTDVVGYQHTPALLGAVELAEGDENYALAVVHQFIQNQGDAWSVSSGYLDRFIDDQRVLSPESRADDSELQSYLLRMRTVGRRLAEMHLALASRDDIAEFAPESIGPEDIAAWTASVAARARETFDALSQRRADMSAPNQELTDRLLADRDRILAEIEDLLPRELDAVKIRHHGDFHLGQMLIVKDDVAIIDFEGEPQRPVGERRRKASAARDVAGFIRSIDYSATAALDRMGQVPPEELVRLRPALDNWRDAATETFYNAYRETVGDRRLLPSNAAEADRLLRFFLLEKALYEIEYELANRPAWLHVPLAGALRLLQRPESETAPTDG
jgi:maltose alpha-D-glucosyltransferase/alpha-amylase